MRHPCKFKCRYLSIPFLFEFNFRLLLLLFRLTQTRSICTRGTTTTLPLNPHTPTTQLHIRSDIVGQRSHPHESLASFLSNIAIRRSQNSASLHVQRGWRNVLRSDHETRRRDTKSDLNNLGDWRTWILAALKIFRSNVTARWRLTRQRNVIISFSPLRLSD